MTFIVNPYRFGAAAVGWLGTWANRREITVSNTNIDSDLTHFALLVFINSTAGTGSTDVTDIFTEITTNSLKMAVTKSDGTTEIYVEIEKWDNGTTDGVLWVSKSDLTLSSSGTTTLYIYYDSAQADNTSFVAVQGSRTEVWDTNYEAVYHLSETSGTRTDSTSNNNDLADNATVTGGTGQIDGGGQFTKANSEYLSKTDTASLSITGDLSYSSWVSIASQPSSSALVFMSKYSSGVAAQRAYLFYYFETGGTYSLQHIVSDGGTTIEALVVSQGSAIIATSTLTHVAVTWDASTSEAKFYVNGAQFGATQTGAMTSMFDGTGDFRIGASNPAGSYFDGVIDQAQLSSFLRPAAWIKAEYHSGTDNIMSYGATETL